MRSSVLLASAMAAGALAGPIERRKIYTETRITVETVTVYVTPGQILPTEIVQNNAVAASSTSCTDSLTSTPSPVYVAPPSSSTSCTTTSTPAPAPSSIYVAPSPVVPTYTPVVMPPPPPQAPTSTVATSTYVAPAPSSSSSQAPPPPAPKPTTSAPAPSPPAPAPTTPALAPAPAYGVTHTSGKEQASFCSGTEYQDSVLWHHNRARANHGAGNLQWSDDCATQAAIAADHCDFEHHTVEGQGQNLFTVSGDAYNVTAGVTESWYKGEADIYNWWGQEPPHDPSSTRSLDMEEFEKYGHLSQMVWKGTTHVGCVTIDCGSRMTVSGQASKLNKYTVCNYSPPGNFVGEFSKNVGAPAGSYNGYTWTD